ncbi:lebercilin-like isoform X1 [Branchiostoma lanceolatum]|uniref:lebercilin-like isoform X1 n=1 Tax=Branchiostoma lanceolatum TaxID=7740 RepID=UPI0034545F30
MTAVLPPQQPSYGTDTGIGSGDSFFDDTPSNRTRSPSPPRRSPSPPRRKATMSDGKTRSRSRSDSYTDASYSDSFDSESETRTPTPTRAGKKKGKRASSETSKSPRKDKVSSSNSSIFITRTRRWPSSTSLTSAKTTVTKHHAGSRGPRYRPQSLQNTPRPQGQGDIVTRRMLSARRVKIKDLTSQIFELHRELDDLKRENKLLKMLQHKQEKALTRFEDQESDLPQLLARHSAEVRNLKERLRHKQDSNHRSEQKIKDLRDDLEKKEHQVSKLQKIVRDKNLAERDELNRKLMRTEQMLLDKEKKVTELNKHLELVQGSSTRQLNSERARHKETQDKLSSLQEEYERLQNKLKEKEKELDIRNIYSNRLKVGGSKAPSVENSPRRPKAHHKNTATDETKDIKEDSFFLTAQLNDSLEEERKRREEEERKQREWQEQEREDRERRQREEREREERERRERETRERELQLHQDRDRRDREVEERERMARLMKERLSQSDDSQLAKDLQRAEEDRRMEEQREKERKEREERESQRLEQERRAKEEKQRREREEQEQREREAAERRAREEANRLEKDIAAKEEQRKKALLLARLKAIDQGENPDEVSVQNGPVREPKRRSSIGSRSNSGKSQKEWNFRKPDQNLHNGLPSHKDEDDLTFGGYAPTFGTRKTKEPAKKNASVIQFNDEFAPKKQDAGQNKSNLMESLFGETEQKPDRKQSSFGEDDIFSSSTKAKPVKDRSAYPWEKEVNVATNKKNTKLEPTSTLYGGGSAIVDEEPKFTTSKQSSFLPRRPRRENSFGNKPAINAVDSFDDEIEEVIL